MTRALLQRLARITLVLLAVSGLTFALIGLLPGDTVDALVGVNATASEREAARQQLHLDDPLPLRYVRWLGDAVRGDLGRSFRSHEPVADAIVERLPTTLELVVVSQVLALALAVPAAIVAAWQRGRWADRVLSAAALALMAAPAYLIAVILMAVFAVRLGWLPTVGFSRLTDDPVEHARSLLLPAAALALPEVAISMRLLRSDLIDVLARDYVTAATARGLPSRTIIGRHALRPASLGLVTLSGLTIGRILGGTVFVEEIFSVPGIGRYTVTALAHRDFLAVQGVVLVASVLVVIIGFTVDVIHDLIDPRLRTSRR